MHRAVVPILLVVVALCTACSGTRPATLGIQAGALSPCPPTPNCVSSFAHDDEHGIEPLHYGDHDRAEVQKALLEVLAQQPRVEVISAAPDYIYAEFTSLIWRFVDDVEFYLPEGQNVVQVRSASRLGHSDLGVNRERIETLRAALQSQLAGAPSASEEK